MCVCVCVCVNCIIIIPLFVLSHMFASIVFFFHFKHISPISLVCQFVTTIIIYRKCVLIGNYEKQQKLKGTERERECVFHNSSMLSLAVSTLYKPT